MIILLLFSFLAGFVTILAPCIWPLLPIVLSASSGAGKRRPIGITLGVLTSFTIFTLSISYLEKIFHLDPNAFRLIAVIIIGLLGISMLIPSLGARFESFINRVLSPFQNKIQKTGTGFGAGYLTGCSIGLVWAPCAGPILATVATLAATQAVNGKVIAVTLAYVSGLGIPLFFLTLFGSWCFSKMRKVTKFTGVIQQVFGLIMIIAALLIYTNYDKVIQLKILNAFPSYGSIFNKIENNAQVTQQLKVLRGDKEIQTPVENKSELPNLGPASDFVGINHWLNTDEPLSWDKLKGKVVLVDFWTYSCINCIRTLPHVTSWYDKYHSSGFVVIGVHTPEFAFEKETKNVENAIKQFKINYPVAEDNNYETWQNFENHYWPAEYLVDAHGRIRRTHFGEGHYDETEQAIRDLLKEAGNSLDNEANFLEDQTPDYQRTPETYLGQDRMERFSSNEKVKGGLQHFSYSSALPLNHFAYEGFWDISPESAKGKKGSSLKFHFQADKVFLVISPSKPKRGDAIKVWLDGQPVDASQAGKDVRDSKIILDAERLYGIIDLKGKVENHELRLELEDEGITVYAFTFG